MREILFRGKTEEGEWLKGCLHKIDGIGKGYMAYAIQVQDINTCMCRPHSHEVIPETVGQFTGLTDKNGKKIFEGDCWLDTDDDYLLYVVEFRNGQFCFVSYGVRGALMEYGWDETAGGWGECDCEPMTDYNIGTIEIIGNIHDNPELLKG